MALKFYQAFLEFNGSKSVKYCFIAVFAFLKRFAFSCLYYLSEKCY